MQIREVGKEIVPDEHHEEDQVVYDALEAVREADLSEFEVEVFVHQGEVQEVEVDRFEAGGKRKRKRKDERLI